MAIIYILSYSIGEYSDRSENNVAAYFDKDAADSMCQRFDDIASFFHKLQEPARVAAALFAREYDTVHGPLPQPKYISGTVGTKSQKARGGHYTVSGMTMDEHRTRQNARNRAVIDAEKKFYDDAQNERLSDDLKSALSIYPCRDNLYSHPSFSVDPIPIWHVMA